MLFFFLFYFCLEKAMSSVPVVGTAPLKPTERSQTNLIVNYLPEDVTQAEITSMFSQCGRIESCHIVRDFQHQCSGYCFINFQLPDSAAKAIERQAQRKEHLTLFCRIKASPYSNTYHQFSHTSRVVLNTNQCVSVLGEALISSKENLCQCVCTGYTELVQGILSV